MTLRSAVLGFSVLLSALALPAQAAYRMSVWVPAWDNFGLNSMQVHAGKVAESNPVWYLLTSSGAVTKAWNAENPSLRAALSGTDLIPTIQNFTNGDWDGQAVATLLSTSAGREKHAEELTQLVVTNAYQGIDIDYESVPASARTNFTEFIQLLATKLHAARKQLSVTVHPKTSDSTTRSGPGSQDWRAIGAAADTVKIMAYNYAWSTSPAGAISPLSWLDQVTGYAESVIPSRKVIIGLPWYGYDWLGNAGKSVLHGEAIALAQQHGATIGRDAGSGEATFTYAGRTVYFQDAKAYTTKVDAILARHPAIGGFAHWRAGGEDAAIWATVARLSGTGGGTSSPVQPVQELFVINGPAALQVAAGKSVTAPYQITPINGFNQSASVTVAALDSFAGVVSITPTALVDTPAMLTVTPLASAPSSAVRFRIRMASGTFLAEQIVTVAVQAAPVAQPSFTINGPASLSATAGRVSTAAFQINAINGFSQSVTTTVQSLDGFAGTAAITAIAAPGAPAVLTVAPAADAGAATARFRVRMVSGNIVAEHIVTVAIEPAPIPTRRRSVRLS